ncbi:hypothetical protein GLOIN_2v1801902 [Rhizophagus irregularis DAOM 181602=DAOM 197198]|nr:hypothetical protein GLOIN_2v1801902 [Rhizophagus irregularis DAOM 181602=DAOM 197198]
MTNEQTGENLFHVTTASQDNNVNIKSKTTRPSSFSNIVQQLTRKYQLTKCYLKFLLQTTIYDISYREISISFKLDFRQ